jgi:dihydropteroate synthase
MPIQSLKWDRFELHLGLRTHIMGVLNVTPDSFSDGGRFADPEAALAQAEQLVADGADILDIGGESTRPFSDPVAEAEETHRVLPLVQALAPRIPIPISIDTTKAEVARRALDAGAAMINDVSALRTDPRMGAVVARAGVPLILMHMLGTPKTMQVAPAYTHLLAEITAFLADAVGRAEAAGIPRRLLMIDPGVGFGKSVGHNLSLLRRLGAFNAQGLPLVVGVSRKMFIRRLLQGEAQKEPRPDSVLVERGTQAAVAVAAINGAHVVRVHDVARTAATIRIVDAIRTADPCAPPRPAPGSGAESA